MKLICSSTLPKFNGFSCAASTANCGTGYITGQNSLSCDLCATGYERADGGCVESCSGTNSKYDGTKCVPPSANCAENFKNNGQNECIPKSQSCPSGFIDDGLGNCSKTCATNFKNNGLNQCVSLNSSCSVGFVSNNGTCVIPTASNILSLLQVDSTLKCDPLCLVCDSTGKCNFCKPGYTLTNVGNCIACVNCQTCFSNNTQ